MGLGLRAGWGIGQSSGWDQGDVRGFVLSWSVPFPRENGVRATPGNEQPTGTCEGAGGLKPLPGEGHVACWLSALICGYFLPRAGVEGWAAALCR